MNNFILLAVLKIFSNTVCFITQLRMRAQYPSKIIHSKSFDDVTGKIGTI